MTRRLTTKNPRQTKKQNPRGPLAQRVSETETLNRLTLNRE